MIKPTEITSHIIYIYALHYYEMDALQSLSRLFLLMMWALVSQEQNNKVSAPGFAAEYQSTPSQHRHRLLTLKAISFKQSYAYAIKSITANSFGVHMVNILYKSCLPLTIGKDDLQTY